MKKILFVEDEPDQVIMIKTRLEANGYEVITANDGLTGLQYAEDKRPDLILLDIVLPGLDGVEVCKRLKANEKTKHIPVIAITASGEKALEERCSEAGCVDVIRKPYDSKELLKNIERYLR